ncbi:MAG: PP2C family protein-serine/threonine phosphatase, partial [Planctomycetota bacterium]
MYELKCAEIWGGVRNQDQDVRAAGLTASLYSSACDGGKGGDIYYLSVCDAGDLTRVAIADVVGHGEPVSAVSQWLYEALDRHMNDGDGHEVLAELNGLASDRGLEAMTTASIAAYFQPKEAGLFAYAGHHPALVLRRGEGSWTAVDAEQAGDPSNMPLGVLAETGYSQRVVPLSRGDRLFLYTDGVLEAPSPTGELFGRQRLEA